MKIGAIIQARMGSTRLPGKVMLPLPEGSQTLVIDHVVRRVSAASLVNQVIVATTTSPQDDVLVDYLKSNYPDVTIFRGSEQNVLERYYQAALQNELDIVVRITADCPLIDPEIIDQVIQYHLDNQADYTSNVLERTFPRGLDIELISFSSLLYAFNCANKNYEFEHVTPYIYLTRASDFKISSYTTEEDHSNIRITLDQHDDYKLLSQIISQLYSTKTLFSYQDIINLFEVNPQLKLINAHVEQKKLQNES